MPYGRPKSAQKARTVAINANNGAWVSLAFREGTVAFSIKEANGGGYRISTDGGVTSVKRDGAIDYFENDLLLTKNRIDNLVARMDGLAAGTLEILDWI